MNNRFVNAALADLQTANRNPIYGYQHLHVTLLEQAVEKIIPIVPGVEEYVALAKQNCDRNSNLLTWDESAAIYLYSMPIEFFTHLNQYLRAENRNYLKPWFAYLKLFITALKKLPTCSAVVWRGVAGDVGSTLVDNDIQVWWSVNSCSKALNVVEIYLGETGTVFAIHALNARDITPFSTFQEEQEVILMPGSRVRVKAKALNFRNSLFIVHLEEEEEEEESASVKNKQASSNNQNGRSVNRHSNLRMNFQRSTLANSSDPAASNGYNANVHSHFNAQKVNPPKQAAIAQVSPKSPAISSSNISAIMEARATFNLERSVDLRCVTQRPCKARSLPGEMGYSKSAIISSNNEFLLLCGDGNLHLFDETLKLIGSTKKSPISSSNLMDMIWCELLQRFIVLTKEKLYVFDPVTTQLSFIENIRLQEKEQQYVSCTCSYDKLFVATSEETHRYYLHVYKLPEFVFISRFTVRELIGCDLPPQCSQSSWWSMTKHEDDERAIVSVRYNHQRLGIMMQIDSNAFLYTLNLTEQPIVPNKTELSWGDNRWSSVLKDEGRLLQLPKSGEWLIIYNKYDSKFIQVALDCQFKAEWESKDSSQSSFFSISTGFVNLKGTVINAIMFGSSSLVLLLDDSLALYKL